MRRLLQLVLFLLFRTLARLEVSGQENIPPAGGCLLVGNHLGIIDGPLYFALIPRQDATGLAARKHQGNPLFRWVVEQADGIWISQESSDLHALRAAVEYLQGGGLLGVAPEGTRSPTGQLIAGKPGAAFLAARAGTIVIVPGAVTGTEEALQQLKRLRRPHITMTFGLPFVLPPLDPHRRAEALDENTDEMMCRIAALLPPEYRGVYADHPRLQELLAEDNRQQPAAAPGPVLT
jgi:1-acyl-sn-glycerol-3-phosphate acyltransferase